ncbi:hypothetical protein LINPERPRIM_LOCUS26876 [Linum perenne]
MTEESATSNTEVTIGGRSSCMQPDGHVGGVALLRTSTAPNTFEPSTKTILPMCTTMSIGMLEKMGSIC